MNKNYGCPKCKNVNSAEDWDAATEEIYGDDIFSIDEDDERDDCYFICPECKGDIAGDDVL